jgi:hypothetical protein
MEALRKIRLAATLLAFSLGLALFGGDASTSSSKGAELTAFYDSLPVETKWLSGAKVDWRSGDPLPATSQARPIAAPSPRRLARGWACICFVRRSIPRTDWPTLNTTGFFRRARNAAGGVSHLWRRRKKPLRTDCW